jgi:pyridoxal phosphate enzyme (YggS family)
MSISKNLQDIYKTIPNSVSLIAVSKTKPIQDILEAYNAGQKIFGENRIQEMVEKYEQLPKDIKWHMIGALQRNKVKYMAHFVDLIHGVDSMKTLKEINKQALKHDRIIHCLLQIKIAREESKFGMSISDVENLLDHPDMETLKNVYITGFMGMASFTDNTEIIQSEFQTLKTAFDSFQTRPFFNFNPTILSMGMSGDYPLAIEAGSNMIRVGSAIFGSRNYI